MTHYDYQLAAGHDNSGNLANVETTLPAYNDRQTFFPRGRGEFNDGILKILADGTTARVGFKSFNWPVDILTYEQWDYLQSNYCTGSGISGPVTVRTRLVDGTYANYNATMILPDPPDTDRRFVAMRNVSIRFIHAEAI